MSMQIINYTDTIGHPSVIGEFDLYFPAWEMTLSKLRVIRTKKGGLFVTFPSWCEKFEDGSKKFHPYISFSDKKSGDFQKAVKILLNDFLPLEQANF